MADQATVDTSGLTRVVDRLSRLDAAALGRVEQRLLVTLGRRLPAEASRLASAEILALSRARVRKGFGVSTSQSAQGPVVALTAETSRIPLREFGARYGGRKTPGATATVYRDRGVQTFQGTFAIKGRGVQGGIFQRVPESAHLPIVERAGASIFRAVADRRHGDIIDDLTNMAGELLQAEAQRLLRVELR